jgi:MFS family permease
MSNSTDFFQEEKKAITYLSFVYGLRMLALFLVMPVISYDFQVKGYDNSGMYAGFVIGVYGLSQAIFQIPFGILSDKVGRKKVIIFGLLLFSLGSFMAVFSNDPTELIVARLIQGMGAISAVVTAFLADLTRPFVRTKAMAFIGLAIAGAFIFSLVFAPLLYTNVGLNGLFSIVGGLGILAILCVTRLSEKGKLVSTTSYKDSSSWKTNKQLYILFFSSFCLMLTQTSMFIVIPLSLISLGFSISEHWMIYAPVLAFSFIGIIVPIKILTKTGGQKFFFTTSILVIIVAILIFWRSSNNLLMIFFALSMYFLGFNLLEAILPSWVSRLGPSDNRGFCLGLYNTCQAAGIFVGGVLGGVIYGKFEFDGIILMCLLLLSVWSFVSFRLRDVKKTNES